MSDAFAPTHEFHLRDGTIVLVRAELRGDWVAFEADGTSWHTVVGDAYPHWTCRDRDVDSLARVVKHGHRFHTVAKGAKSHRYVCECGKRGSWCRSDDRAADNGDRHHRDAVRVASPATPPTASAPGRRA